MKSLVSKDENMFIFGCPHCGGTVVVNQSETACCIFRHAVYKANGSQVNPHASKNECDRLVENNLVNGCGKPFRFVYSQPYNYVEKCDYI